MKTRALLLTVLVLFTLLSSVNAQKESEIVEKYRKALRRNATDTVEPPTILKGRIKLERISTDAVIYYQSPATRLEMAFGGLKFVTMENDSLTWEYNGINATLPPHSRHREGCALVNDSCPHLVTSLKF